MLSFAASEAGHRVVYLSNQESQPLYELFFSLRGSLARSEHAATPTRTVTR